MVNALPYARRSLLSAVGRGAASLASSPSCAGNQREWAATSGGQGVRAPWRRE